jgi:hypothetical protein
MRTKWLLGMLSIAGVLAGCENEPVVVASNKEELVINKVDLLFVVDDSGSMEDLQTELPELLDAFVSGSDEPGEERPQLTDIHVAVVSTDMGAIENSGIEGCQPPGDDGVFIELTSDEIEQCNPDLYSFVEYKNGVGSITTEVAAACVPDVGTAGCGFEQPLEAMLKALWPASDTSVQFMSGEGHGEDANAGFLREDSLLVVVVVSDEDDCSASDPSIFVPNAFPEGLNTRCVNHPDSLFAVDRYVRGLKGLREADDDPIIFVALAGIPAELTEAQADIDLSDERAVEDYYDEVLDADAMQVVIDEKMTEAPEDDGVMPSCTKENEGPDGGNAKAYPPRRLVEVAQAFGNAGVLGSLCGDDFATTIGGVIRATAEKL